MSAVRSAVAFADDCVRMHFGLQQPPRRAGIYNDGFVLSGSTEDLSGMSGSCLTTYGNPTLVLTAQ